MEDTKASNQHWYEAVPKPTMFRQTLVKPQKKFEKKHTLKKLVSHIKMTHKAE